MRTTSKKCKSCFWRFLCIFSCFEVTEELDRIEQEIGEQNK
jgi:radical SAM protein with 4Fe4S-binding SPASM domain